MMMAHVRYRRRPGFSLVEILVASVILALGLVSLSQLYMAAMWTYTKARNLTVATERAQLELEKIQNLGFYPLENGPNPDGFLPAASGGEYTYLAPHNGVSGVTFPVGDLPAGLGTITWEHFPPNTVGNDNLLKVIINVTWDGARDGQSETRIVTLVANK